MTQGSPMFDWLQVQAGIQRMEIAFSKLDHHVTFRSTGGHHVIVRFDDGRTSLLDLHDGLTFEKVETAIRERK